MPSPLLYVNGCWYSEMPFFYFRTIEANQRLFASGRLVVNTVINLEPYAAALRLLSFYLVF